MNENPEVVGVVVQIWANAPAPAPPGIRIDPGVAVDLGWEPAEGVPNPTLASDWLDLSPDPAANPEGT